MFTTYVLKNTISGKIYIGQTENLDKRLLRHNGILLTSNKSYTHKQMAQGAWICGYKEEYQTRIEAMKREKELKSSRGRDFIRKVLGP